jgi:hypothetical protein
MFIPFFLELKAEKITGDRPGLQAATRELSR